MMPYKAGGDQDSSSKLAVNAAARRALATKSSHPPWAATSTSPYKTVIIRASSAKNKVNN